MKILGGLGVAVVAVLIVWFVARRQKDEAPTVKPYREIRRTLIDAIRDENYVPSKASRPEALDGRIGVEDEEKLSALWPPNEANWSAYLDTYDRILESVSDELNAIDPERHRFELISAPRRVLIVVDGFEREVNNGGFDQYYLNSAGDGATFLVEALSAVGAKHIADIARRANLQFSTAPDRYRERRLIQLDKLSESVQAEWERLDGEFFDADVPFGGVAANLGGRWILDHPSEFFK